MDTLTVRTTRTARDLLNKLAAEEGITASAMLHVIVKAEWLRRHPATWDTTKQEETKPCSST
jgi:hypothetical protein